MNDYPVSELRIVGMFLKGSHIPTIHYMHLSQVDTFVEATVALHYTHGNPHLEPEHQKMMQGKLWKIIVNNLTVETVSYWWCAPNLQKNSDPKGAQLHNVDPPFRGVVWAHPDLRKQWEEERRAELLAEMEM